MTRNPHLAQGTRVQVGSILITETFGNMKISITHSLSNTITIERGDIEDLMVALDAALQLLEGPPCAADQQPHEER